MPSFDPFLINLWSIWGSIFVHLDPSWPQMVPSWPKLAPSWPHGGPKVAQVGSSWPPDTVLGLPGPLRDLPGTPQGPPRDPPGTPQGPPRDLPGTPKGPPRTQVPCKLTNVAAEHILVFSCPEPRASKPPSLQASKPQAFKPPSLQAPIASAGIAKRKQFINDH